MRKIFDFLSIFDWVTPTKAFVESVAHDPTFFGTKSWTFFIPYDASLKNGYNAAQIKDLMESVGIKTWGKQISGGDFFFTVSQNQARYAERVLLQNNIPLRQESLGAPAPPDKKYNNKKSEAGGGVLSAIDKFIDSLW